MLLRSSVPSAASTPTACISELISRYSAFAGTIHEQFIEDELTVDSWAVPDLIKDVARTGARLDSAGFVTLSFLNDLRRSGNQVYYVDFGFDLGEPRPGPTCSAREDIDRRIPAPYKAKCLEYYEVYIRELARGRDPLERLLPITQDE